MQILPTANPLHHGLMEHITLIPLSPSLSLYVPFFFPLNACAFACTSVLRWHVSVRARQRFQLVCMCATFCTAKLVDSPEKPRTFRNIVTRYARDAY